MKIEKILGFKSPAPQYNPLKKESDSDWLLKLEKIDDAEAIKINGGTDISLISSQESLQNHNRRMSFLSNIIKKLDDTTKTIIGNLR